MNIQERFRALLKLQDELDAKLDEFIVLVKELDHVNDIAEIDGDIYQLRRVDAMAQLIKSGRKHHGFFAEYRLINMGKPAK